ncbi:MAG: hypothetical protein A2527_04480 [Candidatus Lambdaproteobacteria bacterium RIFOXYD2_FULL_50_16]|uniref:Flagellar motor switch protein FliG C-terminal domain-containing protein n=1 Tax=Candidatus Lambdaproteobacteria bacterium RIFOXYD2_FULL_50_16 TaxID=1817772 RepID=A0A1F6GDR6_9PROT|nr:MAG: hypothetical protein A2527_04480 [Candidatus Lambdaproteobacteria bacterium RIFOXYD2_FULL_50_16]
MDQFNYTSPKPQRLIMRIFLAILLFWPALAGAKSFDSPLSGQSEVALLLANTLKSQGYQGDIPKVEIEFSLNLPKSIPGPGKQAGKQAGLFFPKITEKLGAGGFEAVKVKLASSSLTSAQTAALKTALGGLLGLDPQKDWLTQGEALPAITIPVLAEEQKAITSTETLIIPEPEDAPEPDLTPEPLGPDPAKEARFKTLLAWIWGTAALLVVLMVGSTLWLRRSQSPKADLKQLRKLKLEEENLDFSELKEFKELFKESEKLAPIPAEEEPAPLPEGLTELEQVKNDLGDLLRWQPDWALELAEARNDQELSKLMALFGPERSKEVFGPVLGPERLRKRLESAAETIYRPDEEGSLLMELHRGFFLEKLSILKAQKESPKTQAEVAQDQAEKSEEAAAFAFIAQVPEEELYLLLKKETPLIQSLALRHWAGPSEELAQRLPDPLALEAENKKRRPLSNELVGQIAQGLAGRLEALGHGGELDLNRLEESLILLADMAPIEREEHLLAVAEDQPNLAEAARQAFYPWEEVGGLDPSLLIRATGALDPQTLAQALSGLAKPLQEPLLFHLSKEARSQCIKILRANPPAQGARLRARRLLAMLLKGAEA